MSLSSCVAVLDIDSFQLSLHSGTLAVTWGSGGLRVLALAYGRKTDALQFVGLVGIMDPPRIGKSRSWPMVSATMLPKR